ncbi:MAG: AAA-like domain-containing protein [Pleurocapsa sp.]
MFDSHYYKVGGSLRYGHPTYITRNADRELYTALKQQEFCFVLNSRQMGKSSLRVRTMKTLVQEGFNCVAIDLGILGRFSNCEQWYGGLVSDLWRKLRLTPGINDDLNWWRSRQELSPIQRFSQFIEDILLTKITTEIIIFLDEIDNLIGLDFRDDFISLIRTCSEKRTEEPAYDRLTFCLLGVAAPSILRIDKQTTPFNIGRAIHLSGFTLAEAQPLLSGLQGKVARPEMILAEILQWTKGQPFLTQKLCYLIVRYSESPHPNVRQIVENCLIDNWELQDEPEHLKTIRDRLLYNRQDKARLLGLYQQILQQRGIPIDDSEEQVELRLSGLVVKDRGKLVVRNPIYQAVFNLTWVKKQLAAISPYQGAIATWLQSGCQDTSRLLRGKALVEGQNWEKRHSISREERLFLRQSEYQARKEERQRKLAQRAAIAEKELAQERKIARWQRLFLLSSGLLIGGLLITVHQTNISRLKVLTQSSQALYASGQKLDALVAAIAAKQQLTQLWKSDQQLETQVDGILQEIIYQIQEYNRLLGHKDLVYTVAISSDGNFMASGGTDRTLILWHKTTTGWQQGKILQHDGWVVDAAISKDGNLIATASRDRTVKLWSRDGRSVATLLGHQQPVNSVAIFPDNSQIVSGSDDGVIKIWQPDGKLLKTLTGHTDAIQAIAITPDGKLIISGSEDKTIKIWQRDGKLLQTLTGHTEGVRAIAISPKGNLIASGSRDKTIKIWNLQGREIATLQGHIAPVYAVNFHPQGQQIVSGSADNTIKIWHLSGENLATLQGHTNRVWDVTYTPDGNSVISASWDKTIRLWHPNNHLIKTLTGHQDVAIAVAYSPQFIASASDDKTVKLWDHDGSLITTFTGHTAEVYDVAIHPHQPIIASAGADKTIQLWQPDGKILHTIKHHQTEVWAVAISPDGRKLVSGGNDNTVKIWDFQGNLLRDLREHQHKVWDLAINHQGNKLASASEDNTIKIWDFQGNLLQTLTGHTDAVRTVAYSNNHWLVSGSEDCTVKIWNANGQVITTLKGHQAAIKDIAISPDNRLIATADDNGKIILWSDGDRSWYPIHILQARGNSIWSLTFSPEGQTIATAGEDFKITLWNLTTILPLDPIKYGSNWLKNYSPQQ